MYAFKGVMFVFKNECNFRLHIIATVAVIFSGFLFSITKTEWLFIIFAVSIVLSFEMINSAVEYLSDFVSPDYSDIIKTVKDASAGAVLISATGAFIVGTIIFIPKIIEILLSVSVN